MTPLRQILWAVATGFGGVLLIVVGALASTRGLVTFGVALSFAGTAWIGTVVVRAVLQQLLWRVGRRLLVSYVLVGLLPIPVGLTFGFAVLYVLSGQLATRRAELEIHRTLAELGEAATAVGTALSIDDPSTVDAGSVDPTAVNRGPAFAAFEPFRVRLPGIGLAYRLKGEGGVDGLGPIDPSELLPEGRYQTSLDAVGFLQGGRHFLAAVRPMDGADVVVYLVAEPHLRERLEGAVRIGLHFPQAERGADGVNLTLRPSGLDLEVTEEAPEGGVELEAWEDPEASELNINPPTPVRGAFGWLDWPGVLWMRIVQLPYVVWDSDDWHAAIEGRDDDFLYLVRTSVAREYVELFDTVGSEEGNLKIASSVVDVLYVIGIAALAIYVLAALGAGVLVYRIAQATQRLSRGFGAVEAGAFEHRESLRGRDQLADLIAGFNHMVEHLEEAVDERAEKEALERELRVARDLQQGLLPPPDFAFPGLDIATDFQPAAAIGGDFYHFERYGDGRFEAVIADVSGHGLATGIVMSAAKALVSALSREDRDAPSMLARVHAELRELTDRRTFVTLGHYLFDLRAGRLEVTNAGHLPIYRVTSGGEVRAVECPSLPLGTGIASDHRTVTEPLEPGDLWVTLSDGIVEGRRDGGELFGFGRLEAVLADCAGASAAGARDRILDAWRRFVGGAEDQPDDDRTLIVVGVGTSSSARPGERP
ncbi:MAG: SpoIIE family protein phosphatase [Acidobacteriota bacterium]